MTEYSMTLGLLILLLLLIIKPFNFHDFIHLTECKARILAAEQHHKMTWTIDADQVKTDVHWFHCRCPQHLHH